MPIYKEKIEARCEMFGAWTPCQKCGRQPVMKCPSCSAREEEDVAYGTAVSAMIEASRRSQSMSETYDKLRARGFALVRVK